MKSEFCNDFNFNDLLFHDFLAQIFFHLQISFIALLNILVKSLSDKQKINVIVNLRKSFTGLKEFFAFEKYIVLLKKNKSHRLKKDFQ